MLKNNYVLSSKEIRGIIKKGILRVPFLEEGRIQPSSFEPTIGDYVFVLDAEINGLLRVSKTEKIYDTLLKIPARQRKRVNISNGFELKKGFTYLIPLRESVKITKNQYVKSSPKSSAGRLFLKTRLLADYNACFDEVVPDYCANKRVNLWLLVQPLAFNVVVWPGVTLNQLRFVEGFDCQLSPGELIRELKKNPILYEQNEKGKLVKARTPITDGLVIHLNLSGKTTERIVGLRARQNPEAIDLSKESFYQAEDFFEPVKGTKTMHIEKGEYYLLSSAEILKIPDHLNVQLQDYSHVGFNGPLHFAGFIDNGFEGDLVFEIRSDELSRSVELVDGMPISKADVFRTSMPDKIYGRESEAHYKFQVGPRVSKYFQPFDYTYAARNYKLLNRSTLVQEKDFLLKGYEKNQGFKPLTKKEEKRLLKNIFEKGFYQSRYDCEDDELLIQPIAYSIVFGPNKTVLCFGRGIDRTYYPEDRLFGKKAIVVSGHFIESDGPDFFKNCIKRAEEEKKFEIKWRKKPTLIGTLVDWKKPIDEAHFGLVMVGFAKGVRSHNKATDSCKMVPIDKIMSLGEEELDKFETWSKDLIEHLDFLYNKYSK